MIPPEKLKQLAFTRKKEFRKLAGNLKQWSPRKLDDTVHELHQEAFDDIDCLKCAACCKTLGPRITNQDINRLSKALRLKPTAIYEKYLRTDEDGDIVFKSMPCPFLLDDNYCSVYQYRPKACREYPHTNRVKFYQIIDLSLKNISTCPAVYQIFDRLSKLQK